MADVGNITFGPGADGTRTPIVDPFATRGAAGSPTHSAMERIAAMELRLAKVEEMAESLRRIVDALTLAARGG